MSSHWDNLSAATDGLITPQDFESAAYRLVAEQCLYYSDQRSRTAYGIVERYEKEMATVLAPRGITVNLVAPGTVETDFNRAFHDAPGWREGIPPPSSATAAKRDGSCAMTSVR